MARKGNPISVRLDLNRSSDSSWFLFLSRVSVSILSIFLANFLGRFLEKTGVAKHSFSFLLLLLLWIFILILLYRRQRKAKASFFILLYFFILLFSSLLKILIFPNLFCTLTTAAILIHNNISSSSEELINLPHLESSSSTESLGTYRNFIAADNEAEIYQRIRALQTREYYNIPPQNAIGEYETIVRDHFDQARNVEHFLWIFDRESFELEVLEQKGQLQDRLFHLMLSQPNISTILELSPYSDIRKEAYEFLKNKVEPFNDPSFADQRALMSSNLQSFIEQLNEHGRNSQIYREFYRHFTDEDFRRSFGFPLP